MGDQIHITVVDRGKFWLGLAIDLRRAEGRAEGRMLRVIREAAIGHRQVVETKTKSIFINDPDGGKRKVGADEITKVVKELPPRWQPAAWFLERRYPEKYSRRKIIEGQLPKDIPYEVFMTAKLLLQLPKPELNRIVSALRGRMYPQITGVSTAEGVSEDKADLKRRGTKR